MNILVENCTEFLKSNTLELKKNQIEFLMVKNRVTQMKSVNEFKDKLDTVKKELVYTKTKETTQNEAQRKKTMEKESRMKMSNLFN